MPIPMPASLLLPSPLPLLRSYFGAGMAGHAYGLQQHGHRSHGRMHAAAQAQPRNLPLTCDVAGPSTLTGSASRSVPCYFRPPYANTGSNAECIQNQTGVHCEIQCETQRRAAASSQHVLHLFDSTQAGVRLSSRATPCGAPELGRERRVHFVTGRFSGACGIWTALAAVGAVFDVPECYQLSGGQLKRLHWTGECIPGPTRWTCASAM